MVKDSILDSIPHIEVKTVKEKIGLYRLGIFDNMMFELVELKEKEHYPSHVHIHSEATLRVVIGEGDIILEGKEQPYHPGKVFHIPKGTSHGFKVKTATLLLSCQEPAIIDPKTGNVDIEYL
ncbi:MAG: cupin domain-containing protein [Nanoarchaeota archaeon]